MVFSSLVVLLTLIFSSQGFQPLDFHDGIYEYRAQRAAPLQIRKLILLRTLSVPATASAGLPASASGFEPEAMDK
jgi:hypothetical protein